MTTRDYLFIGLVSALVIAVCVGLFRVNRGLDGGGDFLVHWAAARGFLFDKIDPYSGAVPARVQELVYGGQAAAGQEPYILDTPFQLLLLYFPFALPADPIIARSLFTVVLQLGMFAFAVFSLRLTGWSFPIPLAVIFALFAVFNFYSIQAVYEASPVLLMGLCYAAVLLLMQADLDELAGMLLAVSLYYWEVGGPFVILVLLHAYRRKRVRLFAGLLMLSAVLLVISFLVYPGWIIPFLRAAWNNLKIDFGFTGYTALNALFPLQGQWLTLALSASLLALIGYEFSRVKFEDDRHFFWTACMSLAAAPLLGFRTELEHLAILILPLAWVCAVLQERWQRAGKWIAFLLILLAALLPWALSLNVNSRIIGQILFLFLPLFTLFSLYWVRWWAIRPPRIWSDLIERR